MLEPTALQHIPTTPTSIYLAGKIAKNDWRHEVVGRELKAAWGNDHPWDGTTWPTIPDAVHGLGYVGPYFMSDDHGCGHGDTSHGCGVEDSICGQAYPTPDRQATVALCFDAIERCDIFFAWIDADTPDSAESRTWAHCTAYGTLIEIGYAKALGKTIVLASPFMHDTGHASKPDCTGGHGCACGRNDLWFAFQSADMAMTADSPVEALQRLSGRFAIRVANDQKSLLESPIERDFWSAYCDTMPTELAGLVPQFKVKAGGKNYRLDFALPDKLIAFEMDGKTYHDTDRGWTNDRRRDLALELDGWRVHRFDGDLIRKDPAAVVAMCVKLASSGAE